MKQPPPFAVLRTFVVLLLCLASVSGFAQAPQKFNYQGIARDAKGNPLSGQTISLKLSVLPTQEAHSPEFEETHTVSTNAFGLYTLQVGNGTPLSGSMQAVKWESGNKYIRVAIDPRGGTDYADAGTTQLLSVPYALFADRAGSAKNGGERTGTVSSNAAHVAGDANYLSKFTALNVIGKSQVFDNGTSIGIGTASPVATATMHIRRTTGGQYLYMENPTANAFGSFRMYNDNPANFATFTKYGSAVAGGYTGIADKYPFANILGYGNNGPFLNAGTGNIGFAITKAGTNRLKIHIDAATERVGIGGNAVPEANVHFNNTDANGDTLKLTNNSSGHLSTDGLNLSLSGTDAELTNLESGTLRFGTAGSERMRIGATGLIGINQPAPASLLHLKGNNNGFDAGIRLEDDASTDFGSILGGQEGLIYHSRTAGNDHLFLTSTLGSVVTPAMVIKDGGNVGIGLASPAAKLDVSGQVKISGGSPGAGKVLTSDGAGLGSWTTPAITASTGTTNYLPRYSSPGVLANSYLSQGGTGLNRFVQNNGGSYAWYDTVNGNLFNISLDSNGRLLFIPNTTSSTSTPYMILDDIGGRLTIGNVSSTPSGYKLYVEDGILTERLKVAVSGTANWADYVFADGYKLMPLEEVEAFVKENKHLPNVPSAEHMVETGIDVATVDAKLMEKIEELTLYMIELKKEIKGLQAENEAIKAQLKK